MSSYDEPEDWKLYDLCYRATKEQANAVYLDLVATPQWQAYELVDNQLRFGQWHIDSAQLDDRFRRLCRMRVDHLLDVYRLVADLIEKHTR